MATQPPPSEKASEIINTLPSSSGLVTKTGSVVLGTGLLAAAISQELYVVNEETVVVIGTVLVFTFIARVCGVPCYFSQENAGSCGLDTRVVGDEGAI